jgi:hypothetical protein
VFLVVTDMTRRGLEVFRSKFTPPPCCQEIGTRSEQGPPRLGMTSTAIFSYQATSLLFSKTTATCNFITSEVGVDRGLSRVACTIFHVTL